jgi:hypothetical protein
MVKRVTGMSEEMLKAGVDASEAWRALLDAAAQLTPQPAPTSAHFARVERPFRHALAGGSGRASCRRELSKAGRG